MNFYETLCTAQMKFETLYIYIYIYIVIHGQIVSLYHNSSVWLDILGRLKQGSKPAQLYVRLSIRLLGQQAYHVS